jgi:hypothetical protein
MVMLASKFGISLKRWQNSTTAMIKKSPGCPKINKLRVIHRYKADYNIIILKIIWTRKLVWHVHENNRIMKVKLIQDQDSMLSTSLSKKK